MHPLLGSAARKRWEQRRPEGPAASNATRRFLQMLKCNRRGCGLGLEGQQPALYQAAYRSGGKLLLLPRRHLHSAPRQAFPAPAASLVHSDSSGHNAVIRVTGPVLRGRSGDFQFVQENDGLDSAGEGANGLQLTSRCATREIPRNPHG